MKKVAAISLMLVLVVCFGLAASRRMFFASQGATITDWALRVVANGGAMPSQTSIIAMENLRVGLIAANLTNKIWSLCVFVPDSVIAASTPLIKHIGADPWTNSNFSAGDLNVHGLKGNGTDKLLDTGILCRIVTGDNRSPPNANISFTTLITEASLIAPGVNNSFITPCFSQSLLGGDNTVVALRVANGVLEYYTGDLSVAGATLSTNEVERIGFVSANKQTSAGNYVAVASPAETFGILKTNTTLPPSTLAGGVTNTIAIFAGRVQTTNAYFHYGRLSIMAIHEGFTPTEASNFWHLVNTCRESLGGGTGEPIHNYNEKVKLAGGSDISSNTSNALRTFVAGLFTDSIYYRMIFANTYCTDSVAAVKTPVIWQFGAQSWTNNNFGATNLTVNGLQGDASTKSLGVGGNFDTLNLRGFSVTSAGVSRMASLIVSNNANHVFGAAGTAASSLFTINIVNGNITFYCWKFVNVNTNFIVTPSPSTNWASFLSGSRTAANAIAMYGGTNGTFFSITNATGTQNGNTSTLTNSMAHALWNQSATASQTSDRLSFLGLHSGLTQTQTSNLYVRVHNLRTTLGGGSP